MADKILTNEFAGTNNDIYNPPFGIVLQPHDDTLLKRGQGKGLKLYDEIENDPHAFAVLQKRKMAVVAYTWDVEPASQRLQDKKAAEEVKAQLDHLNFDQLTLDLLDAILKGYAVAEIMWATDGSRIYADSVKIRDQRRFNFDLDYKLRLKTMGNLIPGELMPENKFIVHSVGAKDGNPNGKGMGTRLFWPTWFKRQGITFWLSFADRFGQPLPVGKYPAGSDNERDKLLNALLNISQEYAVALPDNSTIEFVQANVTSGGDFYERLCKYMDDQISVAVLGENSTTSGKSSGLNSNQAQVHNEVRLELSKADADLLSGTLNRTLAKWITEYNFPSATPPRIWRRVAQQEDLKSRADRDAVIYNMGFKPTLQYITETYGEGFEVRDMTTPNTQIKVPGGGNAPGVDPAFAEVQDPSMKIMDQLINDATSEWQPLMEPLLAPIQAALQDAVAKGQTTAQFAEQLPSLLKQMDVNKLAEHQAQASFLTRMVGEAGTDIAS